MSENNCLGVMTLTNTLSIILIAIDFGIDDYAIYRFSDELKTRKAKLYDSKKRGQYFKYKSKRFYLGDFIQV